MSSAARILAALPLFAPVRVKDPRWDVGGPEWLAEHAYDGVKQARDGRWAVRLVARASELRDHNAQGLATFGGRSQFRGHAVHGFKSKEAAQAAILAAVNTLDPSRAGRLAAEAAAQVAAQDAADDMNARNIATFRAAVGESAWATVAAAGWTVHEVAPGALKFVRHVPDQGYDYRKWSDSPHADAPWSDTYGHPLPLGA